MDAQASLFSAPAVPSASAIHLARLSNGATDRVFEHWRRAVPHKSGCRLTGERRRKINARLADFSEADLLCAIDQAARDPFLNGDNDRGRTYTDFKTIFRSVEKVESLLEDWARWEDNGGVQPRRRTESTGERRDRLTRERVRARLA